MTNVLCIKIISVQTGRPTAMADVLRWGVWAGNSNLGVQAANYPSMFTRLYIYTYPVGQDDAMTVIPLKRVTN